MKIALKHDVALTAGQAFAAATDFAEHERAARRRGVQVTRTDRLPAPGPGAAWNIVFRLRGRERQMETTLTALDPPRQAVFGGSSQHLTIALVFAVVPLARDRSRLLADLDLRPRTLRGRVMIQSARLARGRIERTLRARFEQFAEALARRAR